MRKPFSRTIRTAIKPIALPPYRALRRIGTNIATSSRNAVVARKFVESRGRENEFAQFLRSRIRGASRLSITGNWNRVSLGDGCTISNCTFVISGDNNVIDIGSSASLDNCRINISGDGNQLRIGSASSLRETGFTLAGDANAATIGIGCTSEGVRFGIYESHSVSIGNDCMFSSAIRVYTSDVHSVLDMDGRRINPAADVAIGDHVWVCNNSIILKGTQLSSDTIVAAGSVVTKRFPEPNVLVGGNPARVIKTDIGWDRERL